MWLVPILVSYLGLSRLSVRYLGCRGPRSVSNLGGTQADVVDVHISELFRLVEAISEIFRLSRP